MLHFDQLPISLGRDFLLKAIGIILVGGLIEEEALCIDAETLPPIKHLVRLALPDGRLPMQSLPMCESVVPRSCVRGFFVRPMNVECEDLSDRARCPLWHFL